MYFSIENLPMSAEGKKLWFCRNAWVAKGRLHKDFHSYGQHLRKFSGQSEKTEKT
jgi:hypothetical protein